MQGMGSFTSDRLILLSVADCTASPAKGKCKCSDVIRKVLESSGRWDEAMDAAICNTGYEHPEVIAVYDAIRSLVERGLLLGSGDLTMPAGPRYTEVGLAEPTRPTA
jgi:hypothetical protein